MTIRSLRPFNPALARDFSKKVDGVLQVRTPETIQIGDQACISMLLNDERVRAFAEATDDRNPIHLDDSIAAHSRFGRRIAHGFLVASGIPTLFATCFPGSVYRSQTIHFSAPVFIDEIVKTTIMVVKVSPQRTLGTLVTCETFCQVERPVGSMLTVVKGEAEVLLPQIRVK